MKNKYKITYEKVSYEMSFWHMRSHQADHLMYDSHVVSSDLLADSHLRYLMILI